MIKAENFSAFIYLFCLNEILIRIHLLDDFFVFAVSLLKLLV